MKVACIAYLHGAGGAERQIIMLANALAERNNDVSLIVLAQNNCKYEVSKKVKIINLADYESKGKKAIINRYSLLKNTFLRIKPDVSIHYWLQSAYLSAYMRKGIPGKIIYAERGDPSDSEYNGVLGLIRKLAFIKINGFVFQSKGARNYFQERIRLKSIIIHNSISVPFDKYNEPCSCREKKIVSVGRLHPQKNQILLIESFSLIADSFPEYVLEIYGEGDLRKQLQVRIDELNLTNRVTLMGTTKQIFDRVYSASLFVLTSDYEGMPNALMEAMALGVPCISTDCKPGGARELIANGYNGYIIPVGDKMSLAETIKAMLNNKADAEKMARHGMEIRETLTEPVIFDTWNQFIEQIYISERARNE